jgi:hypothetical protein
MVSGLGFRVYDIRFGVQGFRFNAKPGLVCPIP